MGISDLDAALPKDELQARCSQPAKAVVDDLVGGKTVAIASGRLEFGPRALGARSILSLPTETEKRDRLNAIKQRHTFQPVAASDAAELVSTFFAVTQPSRFMGMSAPASALAVAQLPAAVHADQTCRVHAPLNGDAPFLQSILQDLYRRGLPPAVLNTSFNARGQPLPRVAADIVDMYLRMDVDVLYLDNLRLETTNTNRTRAPKD